MRTVYDDELSKAKAERDREAAARREAEEWRYQFDICMCGSPMDAHDIGSGHSPVSTYDYCLDQAEDRAKQAEAALADMQRQRDTAYAVCDNRDAALAAAEAERATLRAALVLLLADVEQYPAYQRPVHAVEVARAALSATSTEE